MPRPGFQVLRPTALSRMRYRLLPSSGPSNCRRQSEGRRWPARAGMIVFLEKLFSEILCDRWLLEYDSERAGTFEPLRFMPQDRTVVLELITTKSGALERRDDVLRRVDEANRFVSLERLALRP